MASFASQVSRSRNELLYLVRGTDAGRPAWYYVLVDSKAKCSLFEKALKSDRIDLEAYGTVLDSGYGESPPEAVTQRITEEYS